MKKQIPSINEIDQECAEPLDKRDNWDDHLQDLRRFPRHIKKNHVNEFLTNPESINFSKADFLDIDAAQMLLGYENLFVVKNITNLTACIEKAKSIGMSYMCLASIGSLTAGLTNKSYRLRELLEYKIFDRRKLIGVRCMVNYEFIGTIIDINERKFVVHFDNEFIGVGNQKYKIANIVWPSHVDLEDRLYESIISAPDNVNLIRLESQSHAESMHQEMLVDKILSFDKTYVNSGLHDDEDATCEIDLLSHELGGENDNFARSEENGWYYPEKD